MRPVFWLATCRAAAVLTAPFLLAVLPSPGARARAASCKPTAVAHVPLRNDDLFLSIVLDLDGRKASFIVDTGSEGSLITPEAASVLHLEPDPTHATYIHGPNGRGQLAPNLLIRMLRIGEASLGGRSIPLGALPGLPDIAPPIAGLIGADVLRGFDVELDVPHHRMTLWALPPDARTCGFRPPWPAGSYATIPAQPEGALLTVPFTLDGQKGRALVDSGARSHIVSRSFANRLGISDAALARDPGGITSGVDLNARRYHWHHFAALQLGEPGPDNPPWRNPVLTVSDVRPGLDMLLGADWFARHAVWVSYGTGVIYSVKNTGM